MWALIFIYILIYIIFAIWFKRALKDYFYKDKIAEYRKLNRIYTELLEAKQRLKGDCDVLSNKLESIVELYEITKDVCRSLDEAEVFKIFKDRLNDYISIEDCLFIKEPALDLKPYKDDFIFELDMDERKVGFLIVKGLAKQDEDKIHILAHQFLLGLKRAMFYYEVQNLSISDSLTRLFNRRYFLKRLEEEITRSGKFNLQFSLLMADIDHFKYYNDHFGHLVGDVILRESGLVIKENTRQIDLVGRYGGEEFAILLPETSKEGAYQAAERIRANLEARKIHAYDEELNITISIGLCSFPEDALNPNEIIDKADIALYEAKNKGRNRVSIYSG